MKLDKLSVDGKKTSIEVLDKIFSGKINKKLVDKVLYTTNANFKGRKAKTKQKNEIIGSTAKIWAQKGTGNERHASRKGPIFVGCGVFLDVFLLLLVFLDGVLTLFVEMYFTVLLF